MIDELAALRYCIQVLDERCAADADAAWIWQIKRKVAVHLLRGDSRRPVDRKSRVAAFLRWARFVILGPPRRRANAASSSSATSARLTSEEKRIVLATHPLLQTTAAAPLAESGYEYTEWFGSLRERVHRYAQSRRRRSGFRANGGPCGC